MTTNELLAHRISQLEAEVEALARRTDRLLWALVSLSLSVTTAAIVYALTVASGAAR